MLQPNGSCSFIRAVPVLCFALAAGTLTASAQPSEVDVLNQTQQGPSVGRMMMGGGAFGKAMGGAIDLSSGHSRSVPQPGSYSSAGTRRASPNYRSPSMTGTNLTPAAGLIRKPSAKRNSTMVIEMGPPIGGAASDPKLFKNVSESTRVDMPVNEHGHVTSAQAGTTKVESATAPLKKPAADWQASDMIFHGAERVK